MTRSAGTTDLYVFTLGNQIYRFTSGNRRLTNVSIDGESHTYEPAVISRQPVELQGSDGGSVSTVLRVEMERYHQLVQDCNRTRLLPHIAIYSWDGMTARSLFEGQTHKPVQLSSKGRREGIATFEVLSLYDTALAGLYQNVGWQHRCNWTLFDPHTCRVDKSRYTLRTTISAISNQGLSITLASVSGMPAITGNVPDGRLIGGTIRRVVGGNSRQIITHAGTAITLANPLIPTIPEQRNAEAQGGNATVNVGDEVDVATGCDRTIETCGFYDNSDFFGGHPTIPTRSPAYTNLNRRDAS